MRQPTGSMRAANWDTEKQNWRHLREIPFPSLEKRKQIDVLLGADYIHLQRALVEVSGNIGEPIARLTPLGWTCVGRSIESETDKRRSHCTRTFCAHVGSLDTLVERFWKMDEIEQSIEIMSPENKDVEEFSINSLQKRQQRYMK